MSSPPTAPRVTVLVASRDRLPMLRAAVASALAQDHDAFEVLVIDDGSGPETRAWLEEEEARTVPRLRVVLGEHRGVAAARARGLAEARGELVCILDSDDVLEPGALRRLTAHLDQHPDVALVYANIVHLHADGSRRPRRYRRFASARAMRIATFVAPRVPFKHSGMTFRRATALALGAYPPMPSKIDVDLVLRFLAAGERVDLLDGPPVVSFRVHAGSMSRRRREGLPVWFQLIDTYGPRSRPARVAFKAARAASELLKEAFERVRGG